MMSKTQGPIPPVIFLLSLLVAIGLHFWLPIATIVPPPWTWGGVVLIVAGVGIVIGPAASFRQAGTTIKPFHDSSALVVSGMYRLTRNPMYLGMVTILSGVAVLSGSLSPFLVPVMFVPVLNSRVIRHEEAMLEERFGDAYREFRRSVRRWI